MSTEHPGDCVEPTPPRNAPARLSLVLGLLSFVGGLTSLPGLVAGVFGLWRAKRLGVAERGTAIAGMVLSCAGLVVLALGYFAVQRVRDAALRMAIAGNFCQLGVAIHSYHDANDQLPAAFARNPESPFVPPTESELAAKMSWRVSILPHIEQDDVYHRMALDQPWDSPQNRPFAALPINVLRDPHTRDDPDTRRRVFYGPGTMWPLDRPVKFADISDGTGNTILLAESGEKVTWTRFAEMKFDPNSPPDPATMGRPNISTFAVGMADGSVRTFRKTMNPRVLKAAITPNGGEVVNLDD